MKTTAPIIQQHELTTACNNACGFCYNPERCQKSFAPRQESRRQNLAVAEMSVAHGVMAVCPTGGEPLLVGNHLLDVMAIYKQGGCYISVNTNARLATPRVAKQLAQAGLKSALTSLHGVGKLHDELVGADGAFEETWRGMVTLRSEGIAVTPNVVVTAKNIGRIGMVGAYLLKEGFSSIAFTPFLPSWGSDHHQDFLLTEDQHQAYFRLLKEIGEQGARIDSTLPVPPCILRQMLPSTWPEYLSFLSPRVCMAGRSFGVVSPDGHFRACIQAPFFDQFGGNVHTNYARSWSRANRWAEQKLLPDECRDCAVLSVCGGGCRTSSLWRNQGSVCGKTMYMGQPLTAAEAEPFKQRVVVNVAAAVSYRWQDHLKFRDEGWGVIVFNAKNQSFTILDQSARTMQRTGIVAFDDEKTGRVLQAMGAVAPEHMLAIPACTCNTKALPANLLLPRLAGDLDSPHVVYRLRADTGERYYF
ncbi:MAG: radical SAM protein [Patescibacteria group bacterium]